MCNLFKMPQVTDHFNKSHYSCREKVLSFSDRQILVLQICHITVNYSFLKKEMFQEQAKAICEVFVSRYGNLIGFPNNLTKQVRRTQKVLGTLISFLILFILQKLAANLHTCMIIPQSIAGASNNEKQDLNRTAANLAAMPPLTSISLSHQKHFQWFVLL